MPCYLLRHIPNVRDTFEFDDVYKVSERTLDIYRHNLGYFNDWLNEQPCPSDDLPIPVESIRSYLLYLTEKGYRLNTIKQRFWAIAWLHDINGFSDSKNPVYHPDFRKINRKISLALAKKGVSNKPLQKTPLKAADVKSLVSLCPDTLKGKRDRALLLMAFMAALRRSELVGLDVDDVHISEDGKEAIVTIRRSKTDQLATGQTIKIQAARKQKHCPVWALQDWLQAADITSGPIFRRIRGQHAIQAAGLQPPYVNKTIKHYCEQAGMDPAGFAGHSLRRGCLQSAIEKGGRIQDVRVHARHVDIATTEHYVGDAVSRKPVTQGLLD